MNLVLNKGQQSPVCRLDEVTKIGWYEYSDPDSPKDCVFYVVPTIGYIAYNNHGDLWNTFSRDKIYCFVRPCTREIRLSVV